MPARPEFDAPAWSGRAHFVMLDSDFGTGQRFLAAWRHWQADPERPRQLHYLAPGADPRAAAPEHMEPQLRAAWPPAVPGLHRLSFDGGRVILDLMFGAPELWLAQIDAHVDAFHLGAAQFSAPVPACLARLARPGATLQAGAPQAPLLAAAGFVCHLAPGAAQLSAVFAGRQAPAPRFSNAAPAQRHVIGAGLAGAAACERLAARGWRLTLLERHARPA